MFMIANESHQSKRKQKNPLLIILWTIGLLSAMSCPCLAQNLPKQVIQRRFMWKQVDSSMDNIMDGMVSGARVFKDMLGGMLPSNKVSPTAHSYRLNLDSLPTSTVRVHYIVRQPISTSTHTKYRFPKPNKMFKDYMQNVTEPKLKHKDQSQPTVQYTGKTTFDSDTQVPVYFHNAYSKSNRKTSKLVHGNQQPLNEIIIGKTYDDWTPVLRQNKQQQRNGTFYQNPTAEQFESEDYSEQLPEPEKLTKTTAQPSSTYEVTENSPEASVLYEQKYKTSSSFVPLRGPENLLPRFKVYSEPYKQTKYPSQLSYHQRTAKSLTQWLPVASVPRASQLHFTPAPRIQEITTTTTSTTTPTTQEIIYETYTRNPFREQTTNTVQPTLRPSRQPAVARSNYKPRDLTQRGSIKFGDKLTDI